MTMDVILQNILEKFNPGARQLINAGKSYLKALHGMCTIPQNSSLKSTVGNGIRLAFHFPC